MTYSNLFLALRVLSLILSFNLFSNTAFAQTSVEDREAIFEMREKLTEKDHAKISEVLASANKRLADMVNLRKKSKENSFLTKEESKSLKDIGLRVSGGDAKKARLFSTYMPGHLMTMQLSVQSLKESLDENSIEKKLNDIKFSNADVNGVSEIASEKIDEMNEKVDRIKRQQEEILSAAKIENAKRKRNLSQDEIDRSARELIESLNNRTNRPWVPKASTSSKQIEEIQDRLKTDISIEEHKRLTSILEVIMKQRDDERNMKTSTQTPTSASKSSSVTNSQNKKDQFVPYEQQQTNK